jgi:hypothetical protein
VSKGNKIYGYVMLVKNYEVLKDVGGKGRKGRRRRRRRRMH